MKLQDKVIWIISPEPWGEQMLSKHHYAAELARRGNEIIFIEPFYNGTLLKEVPEHPGVRLLPWKPFRGLRKIPHVIARQMQKREMLKISALTGSRPDVIWSFDNSRLFDLNVLGEEVLTIHHMVDLNQDFEVARAASSAELCLATTRFIKKRLSKYNTHSFNIGHGCDVRKVREWTPHDGPIRIVYTGNLLIPLLDQDRILAAVDRFPQAEFFFVGSYQKGKLNRRVRKEGEAFIEALRSHENVTLTGPLIGPEYHEILASADLFILGYDPRHYEQVANPHKIPELLNTGRVIISNVLDSYVDLGMVEMSDDKEVWLEMISSAIEHIADYNTPHLQSKRKAWAEKHSYERQVNHIETLIP